MLFFRAKSESDQACFVIGFKLNILDNFPKIEVKFGVKQSKQLPLFHSKGIHFAYHDQALPTSHTVSHLSIPSFIHFHKKTYVTLGDFSSPKKT